MAQLPGGKLKGVWLIPTLARPGQVKELIESYIQAESSTPIWFLIDEHDPKWEEYRKLEMPKDCLIIRTGDAVSMGDKVRKVWDSISGMDWIGICNDDHRFITKKWDQTIISQINGNNVVFTQDNYVNIQGPTRMAGAICFSGKWLRTLGYMFLPGQHHLYSDDLWATLCQRPQCAFYLHDVVVEHRHAYNHPELRDETFVKINGPKGLNEQRVGEGGFWPNDKKVYEEWLGTKAESDIQKIMDLQPKIGVMVATPSSDAWVALDYALGLADFTASLIQQNMYFEMARVTGSSLLPHARNSLVDMFMKSKCQKLLFIDADQGFDRNACWPLFRSSRRIIAAITPHKRFPVNLNFEPLEKDKHYFRDLVNKGMPEFVKFAQEKMDANGEIEVNRAGTGMICIDRSVFQILGKEAKEYQAFDNSEAVKHKEYFHMGISPNGKYKGEDWHFCEEAKKHGIPIYINANCVISHLGGHTYRA